MSTERRVKAYHLRGGFSLIEVSMAVLVVALVFVGSLGVIQGGVRGTADIHELTHAFQAARTVIDAVESFNYDDLTDESLRMLCTKLSFAPPTAQPILGKIQLLTYGTPGTGSWFRAKTVRVRVPWKRPDGSHDDVVLKGLVMEAR